MDYEKLAAVLLPDITKTPEYYEEKYPERNLKEGAAVTRFAPSPTGFLHIGAVYASLISIRAAHADGGVFYLRIEDTDKKREMEGGIGEIVRGLEAYGLMPDEGFRPDGSEFGAYGPYRQSERAEIYQCYVKDLIKKGLAYPCFCSEDELSAVKEKQVADKVRTGYYGEYVRCRDLDLETVEANLKAGKPYVIRLRSEGSEERRIAFTDLIRGKIEMPENDQDLILLKRDGIPTYHFAHAVDDHLMRTTLVIRGDEWISSVPRHLELFRVLGFKPPKYAHIAPIMKEDGGGKRKLSKRKDPEAAVLYYADEGYPKESVIEYLTSIAGSDFEDWRRANKQADIESFPLKLKKMSVSGALFDLNKLNDVSKNVISFWDAETVYDRITVWAKEHDPDFHRLITEQKEAFLGLLAIDRGGKNPRKDLAKWSDAKDFSAFLFDELFQPCESFSDDAVKILEAYREVYDPADDKNEWFGKVKSICEPLGFSPDVKAYKQNPDGFKGHVGDVSTVIRRAITGRENTPDLCAIMSLLGQERSLSRMDRQKVYR